MKRHHKTILIVALSVAVILVVYFTVLYRLSHAVSGKLEEKETLAVSYINKAFDLDANNDLWKDIAPVRIHLLPQSARTPHGTTERDILVRMAHNNEEIAVLIEFNDESEDRTGPANPDACAVLFAPGDAPATAQMMGFGSIANVWQWLADRDARKYQAGDASVNVVRELFARGPGTQKELPGQNVEGRGEYGQGRWKVVFKRKLKSSQENELELKPGVDMNIAFAVWNGIKMESFSRKSISILRNLTLEEK